MRAMNATRARNPSVVITAIAQCGNDDDPLESCKPEPTPPLPCGDEAGVVPEPKEPDPEGDAEASEDERSAADEAEATDDDDMAASTEFAKVVSVAHHVTKGSAFVWHVLSRTTLTRGGKRCLR